VRKGFLGVSPKFSNRPTAVPVSKQLKESAQKPKSAKSPAKHPLNASQNPKQDKTRQEKAE
jgi:hypothetical protein